jgi:hypothetical protein
MAASTITNRYDASNSSDTALGISGVFTGTSTNVEIFGQIRIEIISDSDSATDGLEFQFSNDGATWNVSKKFTIPANKKEIIFTPVLDRFFRTVYTNGTSAQTYIYLRTTLLASLDSATALTSKLADGISLESTLIDAFGRLRISEPETLFDSAMLTTSQPEVWSEYTSGTGAAASYTPGNSYAALTNTASQTGRVVRQTYNYFPYQPGKSRLMLMTGVLEITGGIANSISRIGCFDDDTDKTQDGVLSGDGFFFELNGTTLKVVARSFASGSQVDDDIDQADWNIDKLDGSGNSGEIIDVSKSQIFFIEQEWLGVGSVFMGVVINGRFIRCHVYHHSNFVNALPYNTRASLPIRYELTGTNPASGAEMRQVCSTIISEGGYQPIGRVFSANRFRSLVSVAATELPIITIRKSSARVRGTVYIKSISMSSTATANCLFQGYVFYPFDTLSPLTGASFASASTNSLVEYDISATAVDLTGVTYPFDRVYSAYYSDANSSLTLDLSEDITLGTDVEGYSAYFVLTAVDPAAAGGESTVAAITWQEFE